MSINFISSTDSEETRTMHTKSDNIVIMMVMKQTILLKNFEILFCKDIKKDWKNQWEEASLFMIVLIYCII